MTQFMTQEAPERRSPVPPQSRNLRQTQKDRATTAIATGPPRESHVNADDVAHGRSAAEQRTIPAVDLWDDLQQTRMSPSHRWHPVSHGRIDELGPQLSPRFALFFVVTKE
jgi:hypothetical protein